MATKATSGDSYMAKKLHTFNYYLKDYIIRVSLKIVSIVWNDAASAAVVFSRMFVLIDNVI